MRRTLRFRGGQRLGATALNRAFDDVANERDARPLGSVASPGFLAHTVLALEITALGSDNLTCVLPGESANGSAREWTVELPQIYTETSRGAVSYTYSDINTREATASGEDDEDQYLTPPLTVGEVIQARDENGLAWRMLGDGRMWAVDPPS